MFLRKHYVLRDELDEEGSENGGAADDESLEGEGSASGETPEQLAIRTADEDEASRQGWVPKDKYRGEASKWVDARTFIDRGKRINSNLVKEVTALREKMKEFEGTKEAFKKYHEETLARKEEELKEAISNLKRDRAAAIREGDDDHAVSLDDRIEVLQNEKVKLAQDKKDAEAAAAPPVEVKTDPILEEWIEDGNEWFKDDPKLRSFAVALGQELVANGEQLKGRKFLDKVRGLMAEEFPKKFGVSQKSASHVESGSGKSGGSGKMTAASLPRKDRELMEEFVAAGWITEEKFLKDYTANNR